MGLLQLILERASKTEQRQAFIEKQFEKANTGVLKKQGVVRLARMIKNNTVRFGGYSDYVLRSYYDDSKYGILPLKDNLFLQVQSIVTNTSDNEAKDLTYSGFLCDNNGKRQGGAISVNLLRSSELDVRKYAELLIFKKACDAAKQLNSNQDKRLGKTNPNNNPLSPDSTAGNEMNMSAPNIGTEQPPQNVTPPIG